MTMSAKADTFNGGRSFGDDRQPCHRHHRARGRRACRRGSLVTSQLMDRPLLNTYWVIPGRLLAGEYPGDPDDSQARQRLERLSGAGIDSFIDLTEEGELPPYRLLLPKHTQYLRSPIVDTRVPNNEIGRAHV